MYEKFNLGTRSGLARLLIHMGLENFRIYDAPSVPFVHKPKLIKPKWYEFWKATKIDFNPKIDFSPSYELIVEIFTNDNPHSFEKIEDAIKLLAPANISIVIKVSSLNAVADLGLYLNKVNIY